MLPDANVDVRVESDGSLTVEETITFVFEGSFSGAFREIPLEEGQTISNIFVTEEGQQYTPGAPAEIGSFGLPGRFGVVDIEGGTRIVWHFRAQDELREFTIGYRLSGLAVAYDDVVDVNLKVWDDEWGERLERLTATLALPGPASGPQYRVYGHPVSVRGDVTPEPDRAVLRAIDIPAGQFVELRVLFPRELLGSTAGAQVRGEAALDRIVAEERDDAADYERDRDRIDWVLDHLPLAILLLLLLALAPAAIIVALVWWLYGRERRTGYDREYEQEPPSPLEPALVPPLLRQAPGVGSLEFTATLFDLIRRGNYKAAPATTERRTWAGLRSEQVADLEISPGDAKGDTLTDFERPVAGVVDEILLTGPELLSRFRERITSDREANSKRFEAFKSAVKDGVKGRGWFQDAGATTLAIAAALFFVPGAIALWMGIEGFAPVARWKDILLIALGVCACVNTAVLVGAVLNAKLWRRRSPAAQAEAERWDAFRRYLTDFPRLDDAPPSSLELWERYLVYGIAFGIAERVLQGAQLRMPEALHEQSSIYWISGNGDLGSGPTSLGIGDLSAGFGSALSPPSSGSGGFGGGFSGGGRGGGGGGGGGAW